MTEFQGDDGNFYNTESYMDVSLNDIKLITPNDILKNSFSLEPEKPQEPQES